MEISEHRVNEHTTIRVRARQGHRVLPGAQYSARKVINGFETGIASDGATADEAYRRCLADIEAAKAETRDAEMLETTGIYTDLTVGPRAGISGALEALAPSPARDGECHHCGLDFRTCDCR